MKIARILSMLAMMLAVTASAGGLLIPNLYRDSDFYKRAWFANDLVTLFLVVPMLAVVLFIGRAGSQRAQLVWLGLLAYLFYNYAFYLFGAAFNPFFLLYLAVFTLSIYALAIGLWNVNVQSVGKNFSEKAPVRWIAAFLFFMALPLATVEVSQCVNFIFTGKVPEPPSLIFALDLSVVVPAMFLAAVLIWRRQAWGYVLSALMLVKGVTYGAVLSLSATMIAFSELPEKDALLPFYLLVLLGSLLFTWLLLKKLNPTT